jgi:hypothetical protein
MRNTIAVLMAAATVVLMTASGVRAAGVWTFDDNKNEHIQYRDGKRLVFMFGCAHEIGFEMFYPNQSRKEGESKVELSNGNVTLNFQGELYVAGDKPKGDVKLYVRLEEEKDVSDVLQLLEAPNPITIITDAGKIALSVPTMKNPKARFEKACDN